MDLCSLHPDTVELGKMVEGHSLTLDEFYNASQIILPL